MAFEFRMTPEQREKLRADARDQNLSMQELLEVSIFGEIRPRQKVRRKPRYPQNEELPIAG